MYLPTYPFWPYATVTTFGNGLNSAVGGALAFLRRLLVGTSLYPASAARPRPTRQLVE